MPTHDTPQTTPTPVPWSAPKPVPNGWQLFGPAMGKIHPIKLAIFSRKEDAAKAAGAVACIDRLAEFLAVAAVNPCPERCDQGWHTTDEDTGQMEPCEYCEALTYAKSAIARARGDYGYPD